MNLYTYVDNNPVNFIDPMGLCKKGAPGGVFPKGQWPPPPTPPDPKPDPEPKKDQKNEKTDPVPKDPRPKRDEPEEPTKKRNPKQIYFDYLRKRLEEINQRKTTAPDNLDRSIPTSLEELLFYIFVERI